MRVTSSFVAVLASAALLGSSQFSAGASTSRLVVDDNVVAAESALQVPFSGSSTATNRMEASEAEDVGSLSAEQRKGKAKEGWVYLIRHGEKFKNADKTGLSQRGIKRAHCLSKVFGDSKHGIKYILAQDFKPDGRRKRPYETVKPLSKTKGIHLDHHCDRDDIKCAAKYVAKHAQVKKGKNEKTRRGDNVLVVWEHARLSDIAKRLGVKGLHYPSDRYDVVFKVRHGKVHAIYSEECDGLDEEWFNWHGHRRGKHGKGGHGGRLIDDESWAEPPDDDDDE